MGRFFNLLLLVLLVAAAAFVSAPWFAFRALRADARDGDAQGLVELVDYTAVRADLRSQLNDTPPPATPAPSIWTDPLGALRRAVEPLTPPPPAVERYVSTEGLHALTRGYIPGKAPPEPPPAADLWGQVKHIAREPWPRTAYWGPNRARFAVSPPKDPSREIVFTFQRKGVFAWRLVGVRLPPQDPRPAR